MYLSVLSFVDRDSSFDRRAFRRGIDTLTESTKEGRDRDKVHGRTSLPPSLREPVQVRLFAPYTPGASISARLRSSDVYLTSVHNENAGFYFTEGGLQLPTKTMEDQVVLPFTGHYNDLGRFVSLEKITLGKIDAAISAISRWTRATTITNKLKNPGDGSVSQSADAKHLLLLCLILSESIRFPRIMDTVENALGGSPDTPLALGEIDELARKWGTLSRTPGGGDVAVRTEE